MLLVVSFVPVQLLTTMKMMQSSGL